MRNKTIIIDRHICDGEKNKIELEVNYHHNTEIIYLHVTEYIGDIFSSHEKYIETIKQINESLKNNNNKLYVVFGGYDSYRYKILQKLDLSEIEFLWWPTFLLHYTFFMMKKKYGEIKKVNPTFNKHFISYNQKPKQHRAMFIDLMFKHKLNDYGIFSWNELTNEWSNNYKFKFWDEKIVRLDINQDRDFLDVRKDYFTEYIYNHGCLFNIVGESVDNNDMFFITEKTYKNLLIGQPIICIGSPYQNKILKNLGFKIYENLINYSFDEEILIEDRVLGVVKILEIGRAHV